MMELLEARVFGIRLSLPVCIAAYLLLGLAALPTDMIGRCLLFSGLNLAYAWFQDRITFPKTFCDYSDYQKQVPFLIPTKASISMARETLFSHRNEEDAL